MGKVSFKADRGKTRRKVEEVFEKTVIHQRQRELAIGRWDFVIFGPKSDGRGATLRVCVAEQMVIQKASVYVAAVGDPETVGEPGMMSIEEFTDGDVSDDLRGLEIYHVSPLRPINVLEKREGDDLSRMRDKALEEFSERNIAVIETPDESAWGIAALKYLHECDEYFSDPLLNAIRSKMRDTSLDFGRRPNLLH